jgi:hypothetical protein
VNSRLLAALIAVESGGDNLALGDHGRSLGPLQITRAAVKDVNRVYGTSYRWRDMTNRPVAIWTASAYVRIYAPTNPTDEQMARILNGGPEGHKKQSTEIYWRKVQKQMKGNQ